MQAPPYLLLDRGPEVAAFVEECRGEARIAVDLEADSLHSYREKICLVQVSTPARTAVLDPLAAPALLGGLAPLLGGRRAATAGADGSSMTRIVVTAALLTAAIAGANALTLEDRVQLQRTIDRFYYEHQAGEHPDFDDAVPLAHTAQKVRRTLGQSEALEALWSTRTDVRALGRQLARIRARTRFPERLRALEARLSDDPVVLAEALARLRLVGRLVRGFYAADARLHGDALREAEDQRDALRRGALDPTAEHPRRRVVEWPRSAALPAEFRRAGPLRESDEGYTLAVVLAETAENVRAAVYHVPKVPFEEWWTSVAGSYPGTTVATLAPAFPEAADAGSDAPPCVPDDTWDSGLLDGMPDARSRHSAVWTGSMLIVWGGCALVVSEPVTRATRVFPLKTYLVGASCSRTSKYLFT